MKDEIMLSLLGEGGSIKIVKTIIEDKPVFIIETEENLHGTELKKSNKLYSTFVSAFKVLDKKYDWYYLHLDFVEERYKEILRLKLVEHRQKSSFNEELHDYVRNSFQQILQNIK